MISKQKEIFNKLADERIKEITDLDKNVNPNNYIYIYIIYIYIYIYIYKKVTLPIQNLINLIVLLIFYIK